MVKKTSEISGFYKLSPQERVQMLSELADLSSDDIKLLKNTGALDLESADRMIENVVGATQLPLGLALNFMINGKDY